MTRKQKNKIEEKKFVTEAYLDMRLDGLKKDITEGYLDARLDGLKKELKEEITEEMRGETVKILQAVDAVMTRFDVTEKEEAAHTSLHERLAETVHQHDQRIGRLETSRTK